MEILFSYLQQGLSAIIPFVVLLGILIFVHELGHFLVARWCGVRVEVFSLGFGKKLLKYKKGDTTYALSMIPLGGYVKMFGEQPGDHIAEEDKKVSFTHKTVWQRIAIVLAGPLMNFFFAILIFGFVAWNGEDAKRPLVGDIATNSAAYKAGFRSGDELLESNGTTLRSWEEFQRSLNLNENKNLPLHVQVKREGTGKIEELSFIAEVKSNPNILSRYDYVAEIEGLNPYSQGTTIGVSEKSPLYALGLRTGDTITMVNSQPVRYWRELVPMLSSLPAGQNLVIEAKGQREGDAEPKVFAITYAANSKMKSYSLENLQLESSELHLARVIDKSPADKAGLKAGDRITSINNTAVNEWEDVIAKIKSYDGKDPVQVTVRRGQENISLNIVPTMSSQMTANATEEKRYTIGIVPVVNMAEPLLTVVRTTNPVSALQRGVSHTWDISVMTVLSFVRLIENKISPKHIGGVISIGQAASETFKIGLTQFLQMMAIISVNLFILNLLPIPVLDGGHLVFYVIEAIKGAPVSLRKMEMAQQVGLVLLMSLMVFALFNDFSRLLGL